MENPQFEKFDSALVLYHKYYNEYRKYRGYPCWDCFGNCYRLEIDKNNSIESQYGKVYAKYSYDTISYFFQEKIIMKRFNPRDSIEISPNQFKMRPNRFITIFYGELESNDTLQTVLINARKAVDHYREDISIEWYNDSYKKLSVPNKAIIDSVFKYTIHLDGPFDYEWLEQP